MTKSILKSQHYEKVQVIAYKLQRQKMDFLKWVISKVLQVKLALTFINCLR